MNKVSRKTFVRQATGGLVALAASGSLADAQLVYRRSDWKIGDFNRLAQAPARVKQVFDISAIGGGKFLNNIKNSLNGLQFGFGIPAGQIQIVAALHGPANLLNYDDYVWEKYRIGELFDVTDPATGKPAARNLFHASKAGKNPTSHDPNEENSPESVAAIIAALRIAGCNRLRPEFPPASTAARPPWQSLRLRSVRHARQPRRKASSPEN